MKNLDLGELRGQLDEIDGQLVRLFEQRMKICADVAEYKIETGKAVYDLSLIHIWWSTHPWQWKPTVPS